MRSLFVILKRRADFGSLSFDHNRVIMSAIMNKVWQENGRQKSQYQQLKAAIYGAQVAHRQHMQLRYSCKLHRFEIVIALRSVFFFYYIFLLNFSYWPFVESNKRALIIDLYDVFLLFDRRTRTPMNQRRFMKNSSFVLRFFWMTNVKTGYSFGSKSSVRIQQTIHLLYV